MELFAIQNHCVRVKEDFVNGGYVCDDFEPILFNFDMLRLLPVSNK